MRILLFILALFVSNNLLADTVRVELKGMNEDGVQEILGFVDLIETPRGVAFAFDSKLEAGDHGYNIHEVINYEISEGNQESFSIMNVGDVYSIDLSKTNNKGIFPDILVSSNKHNKQIFIISSIKSIKPLLDKAIVVRVGDKNSAVQPLTKIGNTQAIAWGKIPSTGIIESSSEEKKVLDPIKSQYLSSLESINNKVKSQRATMGQQDNEAEGSDIEEGKNTLPTNKDGDSNNNPEERVK